MADRGRGIIGRKVGMTRLFDEAGNNVPVTVIQAGPCYVSQVKTTEVDGYSAVQLAFEDVKARSSTMPVIGHDGKAGMGPKRVHREMRLSEEALAELSLGQAITVEVFDDVKFVDVVGTSKGKGTAGVMKRHNFKGLTASHGTERKHRSPGSIASRATNRGCSGRPKKGIRMAGRMGNERVTVRSLEIVGRDKERNLLLVKGPVPGPNKGLVLVREATRLYKSKAVKAKA
jgi:large subunit ribosomal protein L3